MTITKEDAQMLTALACKSRPAGARQWNPEDVMAEITKLRDRSLPAVCCAVLRAAMDRGAIRPEVISSPGSHWSDTAVAQAFVPRTLNAGERCSVCSMSETACRIRHSVDDHEFKSAATAAREAADAAEHVAALRGPAVGSSSAHGAANVGGSGGGEPGAARAVGGVAGCEPGAGRAADA